jgi:uncharacterized repeat protein (TIGR02543 family)
MALCVGGCIPYFNIPDEELRIMPLKTAYETGGIIDTTHDLEVNKLERNGSLTRLSPGDFNITPGILDTEGEHTIVVTSGELSGSYVVRVEKSGSSTPLVQAVPFKTAYKSGESVSKNELAVYIRNLANGEMTPVDDVSMYELAVTGCEEGVLGPLPAGAANPLTVTVKVPGYSATAGAAYKIWVDEQPPDVSSTLLVIPFKTSYPVDKAIKPADEVAVYKSGSGGAMTPLTHGAVPGYRLSVSHSNAVKDPSRDAFPVAGLYTVTVIDNEPSESAKAPDAVYMVTVTDGSDGSGGSGGVSAVLTAAVIKNSYAVGSGRINPDTDLEVYKAGVGEEMTKLEYVATGTDGYHLVIAGTSEPPEKHSFDGPGPSTVAIVDNAGEAAPFVYTVKATAGGGTGDYEALVQVVPFKTAYKPGETIDLDIDLEVYIQNLTAGGMEKISAGSGSKQFSVNTEIIPAGASGWQTVQVTVKDYPGSLGVLPHKTANYYVWAGEAGLGAPQPMPLVQVIPFKTAYTLNGGSASVSSGDLAVYTRDIKTGEMAKTTAYALSDNTFTSVGTKTVKVTATGYPGGGVTDLDSSYTVEVTGPFVPTLLVVPLRNTYTVNDKITPSSELKVYKSAASGMTLLNHATSGPNSYRLVIKNTTTDPTAVAFPSSGTKTIRVIDNATTNKAADDDYTVTVNQASSYTVFFNKNTADAATITPERQTVAHGQKITTQPTASRMGHTLAGWYTDDLYGPNTKWEFNTNTVTANITLYAKWNVDIGYGAIRYVDGSDGTLIQNVQGKWVAAAPQDKVIYSVTFRTSALYYDRDPYYPAYPYFTYYLGRKGNEAITLNITDGVLNWRPADSDGYIPVSTADELLRINSNGKFRLEADVDLLGGYNVTGRMISRREWTPIGNAATPFTGEFEGSGKVVSNMYIGTAGTGKGFFGYLSHAAVKNLGVDALITGNNMNRAGAVAGNVDNESSLERCYNRGFVTPGGTSSYIGGVVGYIQNGSRLSECYNAGNVTPGGTSSHVGGVAGYAFYQVSLSDCYNVWKVSGTNNTGGVVGTAVGSDLSSPTSNRYSGSSGVADQAAIVFCYNEGEVKGSGVNTGGIAGELTFHPGFLNGSPYNYISEVYGCWNKGSVNGYENTGGIAGKVLGAYIKASITAGSPSSKGRLSANWSNCLGGIAGRVISVSSPNVTSEVLACYVTESVTNGGLYVGGIAGKLEGGSKVSACYVSAEIESPNYGGVVGDAAGGGILKSNWWDGSLQLLWTSRPDNDSDDNWTGVYNPAGNAEAHPFWGPNGYWEYGVQLDPGFGQPWSNLGTPGLDDVLWNSSDLWDIIRGPLVRVGRLPRLSWENNGEYGPDRPR